MNIRERKKLNNKIENALDEIVICLEEDRFYPSVREAGTAPTESALNSCHSIFVDLIEDILSCAVKPEDLKKETTFEEIVAEINSTQDKNIADEFDELTEIDRFVRDNGESKYRYINTVYEHKKTKRFICVEEQCGVGEWDGLVSSVNANETTKKEKVTYQWT